ncbi:helix-turn-helix domain-containing protein [Teredinibacter purpureus]|uniref:winged helix-turn-helix transcriptional regulator n=1 Tax=Teredinibacter purpureus TaxID=2731756 RepID=UPI000697848A|nr:winged helix-turn-helix transcriptional regulator [Teredinibacter purpureus]
MATDNILIKTRQYLQDTIGSGTIAEPKLWTNADHLPFFLQSSYQYYELDLFNHSCLLMSNTQEGETPAVVRKHWLAVSKHYKGDVIYLVEVVSSYNRKRLIEHRVPFLIPGNQLYIPMLGLDLREYFKPSKLAEKTKLSGPAQAVILREILRNDCSGLPAKELANILGYTPMTITRAINELTDRELMDVGRSINLSNICGINDNIKTNPVTPNKYI